MPHEINRFESMKAMEEAMSPGRAGALAFPLFDDSPPEHWLSCSGQQQRRQWADAWAQRQSGYGQPMENRDFLAIAAYEVDGAKMEKSFGWSALSMWLVCAKAGVSAPGLDRDGVLDLLPKLLSSGASVAAFQAAQPDALTTVLSLARANGEPFWDGALALLKGGWNPNAWDPASDPKTASSMQALLRGMQHLGLGKAGPYATPKKDFDPMPVAARWIEVIRAAQDAGFEVDSRSMDGMTALGMCCEQKGFRSDNFGPQGDPRLSALMALGADPVKSSPFWLVAMESDPVHQKEAAAMLASRQLSGGLAKEPPLRGAVRSL